MDEFFKTWRTPTEPLAPPTSGHIKSNLWEWYDNIRPLHAATLKFRGFQGDHKMRLVTSGFWSLGGQGIWLGFSRCVRAASFCAQHDEQHRNDTCGQRCWDSFVSLLFFILLWDSSEILQMEFSLVGYSGLLGGNDDEQFGIWIFFQDVLNAKHQGMLHSFTSLKWRPVIRRTLLKLNWDIDKTEMPHLNTFSELKTFFLTGQWKLTVKKLNKTCRWATSTRLGRASATNPGVETSWNRIS